jgi:hypothetical protein
MDLIARGATGPAGLPAITEAWATKDVSSRLSLWLQSQTNIC